MRLIKLVLLFLLTVVFLTYLNANEKIDNLVLEFEEKRLGNNPRVKIEDIKINSKKEISLDGWYGYIIDVKANVQGRVVDAKDIFFTNGEIMAPDLTNMKTGKSLKDELQPKLSKKYHSKKHLIAGSHDAKDKLVIFSDPLCPFCMNYVPKLIDHVNKNSESIALYYYHFPLTRIHPASMTLSKIMIVAKQKGVGDLELRVYTTNWEEYFAGNEQDEAKILNAFNEEFETKITLEEINASEVVNEVKNDMKMGDDVLVDGTPTVFVNRILDETKLKYEMLGE